MKCNRTDFTVYLDEVESFLSSANFRPKKKCGCGKCNYDIGFKLCAAWENLKIKICGNKRR